MRIENICELTLTCKYFRYFYKGSESKKRGFAIELSRVADQSEEENRHRRRKRETRSENKPVIAALRMGCKAILKDPIVSKSSLSRLANKVGKASPSIRGRSIIFTERNKFWEPQQTLKARESLGLGTERVLRQNLPSSVSEAIKIHGIVHRKRHR